MNSTRRKYLRGLAHGLKPVAQVGRNGLTESLLEHLDAALSDHELIKIKFVDFKDAKRELVAEIGERLDCESAGTIGHVAILYRRARDPEGRAIRFPDEG